MALDPQGQRYEFSESRRGMAPANGVSAWSLKNLPNCLTFSD